MSSVLIVDDERSMRELLVRWLAPAGYETREAEDAEAALKALTANPVDVVLCDVQMPGHDGLWLMARMRERFPDVAIVLATVDETVPPSTSLQSAVIEYLVKPLKRELVLSAVARGVDWHRTAAARQPDRGADVLNDWLSNRRR